MLAGPRAADPRANPDLEMIDRRIRSFAQGTDILKIKLYGPSGLTLYSSDPAQIGENKAANPGVLGALKGNVASELGHRGTIGALDGDRHDRDLVSSYIPIRGIQGIEAVIEIYVDRTAAMGTIDGWRLGLAAVLVAALGTGLGGVWRWGHARHVAVSTSISGISRRNVSAPPRCWPPLAPCLVHRSRPCSPPTGMPRLRRLPTTIRRARCRLRACTFSTCASERCQRWHPTRSPARTVAARRPPSRALPRSSMR
jgi:hypothetical protein